MSKISTCALLPKLREILCEIRIDAFIVGSGDAHSSEYVSERDKRLQYISSFTGSAGTAVVLQDNAYLWTDGRYFSQAQFQLSRDWKLMRQGERGVLETSAWLKRNMLHGQCVGVDGSLYTARQFKCLERELKCSKIRLRSLDVNPIDTIWDAISGLPSVPRELVSAVPFSRSGKSTQQKVFELRKHIESMNAYAILLSTLDEIAWLLNIRGSDISFNPVATAYVVVTVDSIDLFIDMMKISSALLSDHWEGIVTVHEYSHLEDYLGANANRGNILVDPSQLNWKMYSVLGERAVDSVSPLGLWKSIKNEVELSGIRNAHVKDGVALTAFFHWLESSVSDETNSITERSVGEKVLEYRCKMEGFVGPSFSTIAGYGPNSAIIHYNAPEQDSAVLSTHGTFLLDSGGQYLDGTTDVTRTFHFGTPSSRVKDCYTAVLKGNINLSSCVFPSGTTGSRLDPFARCFLWKMGLTFGHGVGHGVGAYLCVHEGPQGIGSRPRGLDEVGFQAGMTTSIEPGYYEDSKFGIRIENVCITVPRSTEYNIGEMDFLGFEVVTMVPISRRLLNLSMLEPMEIEWLNNYHMQVRKNLLPLMSQMFPESVPYLMANTDPL